MTRVLVDLLYFTGGRGGTETYAREIYSRLADVEGLDFIGYGSREIVELGVNWFPGEIIDSGISGQNRVAWAAGELFRVDRAARTLGADLIHAPANLGPIRSHVPVVMTLHDLVAFRHPEWVSTRATGGLLRWMIKGAAMNAAHILTDSKASRSDIEDVLGIPHDRITVTPLAASIGAPRLGSVRRADTIFAPGNRMPHKNIESLIEAVTLIPEPKRPRVVITGSKAGDPLVPLVARLGLEAWIELRGWITDDELEHMYAEAAFVIFPTQFEGFGLPILEAMVRGCPVACSDLPVLREVAGDSAAYFDQNSPAAIASIIVDLLNNPAARESMAVRGRVRSGGFSWDHVARDTAGVFKASVGVQS